jgi:hypothetical protein
MQWTDYFPLVAGLIPTGGAMYIYIQKRKEDLVKEQLKNLYSKLNMMFELEYSLLSYKIMRFRDTKKIDNDTLATELYDFFLRLRKVYLENQLYSSLQLRVAFNHIIKNHKTEIHNAIETVEKNNNEDYILWVARFEFNHQKNKDGNSELERELEKIENLVNEDIYQLMQKKPVQYFYKTSLKDRIYRNEK